MWLAVLAGCALGKLSTVGRSYPDLDGDRLAPGARQDLWVGRDRYAVPHVRARSDEDAWYGLGFVHGQDRLFQAELARRTAFGHLAEWFGEPAENVDVFARTLGLEALAHAEVERLDPQTRAMLEAYTAGLNAAAADSRALPIEHRLLGATFEPWRPEDCLGIGYLMSWSLGENVRYELAAWELRDLPTDVVERVLRTEPHSPPLDAYWEQTKTRSVGPYTDAWRAWTGLLGGAPTSAASNNWVIGGGHTADGLPIVANDPHLMQSVPSLWYAADVSGASFHAAGATLPGVPGFPVGHSAHVAWGLTNVMADVVDVVMLERRGDGYVLDGEVLPFETVTFDVVVDGAPRSHTGHRTRVGPVFTSLDAPYVFALRWATLELEDQLPLMLRRLATARTVGEVREVGNGAPMVVALNLVAADDAGDWGWQTVGGMVERRGFTGRLPYPGDDPALGWVGFYADTPGSGPVPEGFLVTANTRPDHPLADALATTYIPPHRYDRIRELLAAETAHTVEGQNRLQVDRQDGDASTWRDTLLAGVAPTSDDGRTCADLLRSWDLVADKNSAGAAVWAELVGRYQEAALTPALTAAQRAVVASVASSGQHPLDAGALVQDDADRVADVTLALEQTCAALRETLGPDPTRWTWGALHPLALQHPFAAQAPRLLSDWNMPTVPYGGTGATVAAAGHALVTEGLRPVTGMASVRVVMPLSDLGASTLVYPGGQSGHPGHPDYRSHYVEFVHDKTLPLQFDDDDLRIEHALWLRAGP